MNDRVFIKRIVLKNYKSIDFCNVQLESLQFLVGQNGSGKSNFLDSLRFITESLNTSLDHALRDRGGINEVRRRSSGHPTHFEIRLDFSLRDKRTGTYSFRIGSRPKGGYEVQREQCEVSSETALSENDFYLVANGKIIKTSMKVAPAASPDRLFLVNVSGVSEFRPVYDALSRMGFYNINPDSIRELQSPDPGEVLRRDGSNLASVFSVLQSSDQEAKKRIVEYLSNVVPGVTDIEAKHVGPKETLEFRQRVGGSKVPWRFLAANMSDGTLRALGVLTALFQSSSRSEKNVPLVGIEEPEVALHPAAAGILRDSIRSASKSTQVLVTSHSPDLLDDKSILDHNILPVVNENGVTYIGALDQLGKDTLRDHLYTAGELLRMNQLRPDRMAPRSRRESGQELFGGEKD